MRLFGLKSCDTCRKAMKQIENIDFVDARDTGVPDAVLTLALAEFGDALLNTRSTTWRNLDKAERDRPPLELLRVHPTLMKRPLIEKNGRLYLGWGNDVRAALG